ncbi:MAG: PHP domain-containing protein [Planctomycetes bacterium]|nr:PHP domain-containing protein [Planctomycetota bacterium]
MPCPRWFDFHIHTCCSDGTASPAEVLRLAAAAGLEGVSITDHDTLDAYAALEEAPAAASLPWVLPGVEISASLAGEEVHFLGYFPDGIPEGARPYVEDVLRRRRGRIARGIARLRERGFDVSLSDLEALSSGRVLARSHMAEVLVRKRYFGRRHAAYAEVLGPEVVPLPDPEAQDVVGELRRLGGIPVWAHPPPRLFEARAGELRELGLAGAEVLVPRRRASERQRMLALARDLGLLVTGGSDFHGGDGGVALGVFRVAAAQVGDLLARIGRGGSAPTPSP